MKTPICDFVKEYNSKSAVRLHMPGHKGKPILGFEELDITEINGADSLYEADGIIRQSEDNAARLFDTAATFYSTEGSSLCVRAMLELVRGYALSLGKKPFILAGRNAHKVFTLAAALLDFDVKWVGDSGSSYLSCNVSAQKLDKALSNLEKKPVAVYLTSPDYLGNMLDIKSISEVCDKHKVLLLVDNAHGAYLKFLTNSLHPIDLGAHLCCDSAHKTLPVLTGGAYLHISKKSDKYFLDNAKDAMALFGSTSPSYLILQSLDRVNLHLSKGYKGKLFSFITRISELKTILTSNGYTLVGNEPLKLTISTKPYGYLGTDFAKRLEKENIICEFSDPDFITLMLTPENECSDITALKEALLCIPPKKPITFLAPDIISSKTITSIKNAMFGPKEEINVKLALGRILASANVGCPPAVPIICAGELITEEAIKAIEYYGIKKVKVLL